MRLRKLALSAALLFTFGIVGCSGESSTSDSFFTSSSVESSSSESDSSSSVDSSPDEEDSSSTSPDADDEGEEQTTSDPITVSDESEPMDLNIYLYSSSASANRNYVYAWDDTGDTYLFKASAWGAVYPDDSSLSSYIFCTALYISFDYEYEVYTDWDGTETGTMTVASDLSNMFTGLLFRSGSVSSDGTVSQTDDFYISSSKLVESDNGCYDLYLWEDYHDIYDITEDSTFYTAYDFITAYVNRYVDEDSVVLATDTIYGNTSLGDLNIFFYSMNTGDIGYGKNYRDYLYCYSYDGSFDPYLIQMSGNTVIDGTKLGLSSRYRFLPWYIDFGVTYVTLSDESWHVSARNIRFNASFIGLDRFIFRNEDGSSQGPDTDNGEPEIVIDTTQMVAEDDGTYDIFVIEDTSWDRYILYGIDAFVAAGLASNA